MLKPLLPLSSVFLCSGQRKTKDRISEIMFQHLCKFNVVGISGLEPLAFTMSTWRSNQLSYTPVYLLRYLIIRNLSRKTRKSSEARTLPYLKAVSVTHTCIFPCSSSEAKAARMISYKQNSSSIPNIMKPIPINHVRLHPIMQQRR